jgi:1-aminocyclopropane-1-carboxylate deaminase/D-cysteine desulfhydrase-like pyridoxal-dependent ACC family enzyme
MDERPALFDAWPELAVPWMTLGRFPTRVERVERLLPPSVELWVKREDEAGGPYGGNKVRKLEFLLGEARARGAARVCTLGGIGSHHVLATAIYGRQAGFAVEAVLFPQPLTDHVREQLLADAAAGAELVPTAGYAGVPLAVWRARRRPGAAWIAAGGSSVTGSLGWASGGVELGAQIERGELPPVDVIYVALGSCGTAAGLAAGFRQHRPVELVGVRVVDRWVSGERVIARLVAGIERRIGRRAGESPRLRVEHRFFGGAYGRATPAADEAVRRAADAGLRLEPTYTGKAMAALLADARAGRLDGKRVLFIHTYNGADLTPLVAGGAGPDALPPRLRRFFTE